MRFTQRYLALGSLALAAACAPETAPTSGAAPATPSLAKASTVAPATTPIAGSSSPAAAPATTVPQPAAAGTPAVDHAPARPAASLPVSSAAAGSAADHTMHAAAGAPAEIKPPAPPGGASANAGASKADAFCDKYEKHCGFGKPQRHADRAACVSDFNATPVQQGCKNMHLDTAIAGTAAACNGMPSEFCFAIHCLHAAGIPDQTGVTYCK